MQLVSAIKMKKSQQAVVEAKPYQEAISFMLHSVVQNIDTNISLLLKSRSKSTKNIVICISSNKGMCGPFNVDLIRYILKNLDYTTHDFITIGKKASSFLSKTGATIRADFSSNQPIHEVSAAIGYALREYIQGTYAKIYVLYNKYISTVKTQTTLEKLVPIEKDFMPSNNEIKTNISYIIEPPPQEMFDTLLTSYIEDRMRHIIMESEAGEHSARMIAMKNATDSANDVIYNLGLLGNKLRQEKITNELLDMITAKESVE